MNATETFAARSKKPAVGASTLTAAIALGAALHAASPAQAVPEPNGTPHAVVTTKMGLSARRYPSTDSRVTGHYLYRAQVGLVCKVRTQNVGGNSVWYLTRDQPATWIAAKYVTTTGHVNYCKDIQHAGIHPTVNVSKHTLDGGHRPDTQRPGATSTSRSHL